jgi:hypothetical protein
LGNAAGLGRRVQRIKRVLAGHQSRSIPWKILIPFNLVCALFSPKADFRQTGRNNTSFTIFAGPACKSSLEHASKQNRQERRLRPCSDRENWLVQEIERKELLLQLVAARENRSKIVL